MWRKAAKLSSQSDRMVFSRDSMGFRMMANWPRTCDWAERPRASVEEWGEERSWDVSSTAFRK